jgi:hypothetical protein
MKRLLLALLLLAACAHRPPAAADCQAGGIGSTSCSLNQCSVSCPPGQYSCCNADGCRCYPSR